MKTATAQALSKLISEFLNATEPDAKFGFVVSLDEGSVMEFQFPNPESHPTMTASQLVGLTQKELTQRSDPDTGVWVYFGHKNGGKVASVEVDDPDFIDRVDVGTFEIVDE